MLKVSNNIKLKKHDGELWGDLITTLEISIFCFGKKYFNIFINHTDILFLATQQQIFNDIITNFLETLKFLWTHHVLSWTFSSLFMHDISCNNQQDKRHLLFVCIMFIYMKAFNRNSSCLLNIFCITVCWIEYYQSLYLLKQLTKIFFSMKWIQFINLNEKK